MLTARARAWRGGSAEAPSLRGARRLAGTAARGGRSGFAGPSRRGTRRTFNHFTHLSRIQLTSSAAFRAAAVPESPRCWLGSARPALGGGQAAAEPKTPSESGAA